MTGQHDGRKEFFSYQVDLDRRVRADHPLRAIRARIDFRFVRRNPMGYAIRWTQSDGVRNPMGSGR